MHRNSTAIRVGTGNDNILQPRVNFGPRTVASVIIDSEVSSREISNQRPHGPRSRAIGVFQI